MTAIEKINQLSHRIFNTTLTEKTVARSSNPFAKSNFQKNILTEDVYESSNKDNKQVSFTGNITAGTKRIYSTFVGSISNFGSKIERGIQAINEFGVRMKDGFVNVWNTISEIGNKEVRFDWLKKALATDITELLGNTHERAVSKMAKLDPRTEVQPMLTQALASLESEISKAA